MKGYLFHDEIAETLRSLPNGSVVTVPGIRSVVVSTAPVNYDGIVEAERNYLDTRTATGARWFVPEHLLVNEIYDTMQSGATVTINGQDILDM